MAQPISKFFEGLGLPLRNVRWSWGARSGNTLLLRTWSDEYSMTSRAVTVLRERARYQQSESYGLDERIVQLKALWEGGIAGYTVIANVKDVNAQPREIKDYRDDVVFSIKRLTVGESGALLAEVGDMVPVPAFGGHASTHKTAPGEGPYPVDDAQCSGLSTDSYQVKVPAIRASLIEVCGSKGTVTYSDVMNRFGLTFYPLRNAMSKLGHDCKKAGEPIITALIVDKETGRCSQGLFEEFHIDDDELERQRCYALWAPMGAAQAKTAGAPEKPEQPQDDDLWQRAVRFAQVEVWTQQRAFREAVFRACRGRCVISGCDVPEALEAAHLTGTDWRQGQNNEEHGILLRRDLHALYDCELLRVSDVGVVRLDSRVADYYKEFQGIVSTMPKSMFSSNLKPS